MNKVQLSKVKKQTFVRRKEDSKRTYIAKGYNRSTKKYTLQAWDDINSYLELKGSTEVFTGFDF